MRQSLKRTQIFYCDFVHYVEFLIFSQKFWQTAFLKAGYIQKEVFCPAHTNGKGVARFEDSFTPSQRLTIRHQFNSFCKKIAREEKYSYFRSLNRALERTAPLSDLSEEEGEQGVSVDRYPSDSYHFNACGYDVSIEDDALAAALSELPEEYRDIVLLFYFLDMNEREISEMMSLVRSTVSYRLNSALKKLRKRLEGNANGGKDT